MTWLLPLILLLAGGLAYVGGLALARRRGRDERSHSRPGQHAALSLIWAVVPALIVLIAGQIAMPTVASGLIQAQEAPVVAELEPFRRAAFYSDARRLGAGDAFIATLLVKLGQGSTLADAANDAALASARVCERLGAFGSGVPLTPLPQEAKQQP